MPIFDQFYGAFLAAISDYQKKEVARGKNISALQQEDIQAFQGVLNTAKQTHCNPLLLREEILIFLETTFEPSLLTKLFPSIFSTPLHQVIQGVLDKPQYRETLLIAKEQAELKAQQNRIEAYLEGGNVSELVKRVERLKSERETEQKDYATLKQQYQKIQIEKRQLEVENTQLKAELAAFKSNTEEKPKSEKSKQDTSTTSSSVPLKPFS